MLNNGLKIRNGYGVFREHMAKTKNGIGVNSAAMKKEKWRASVYPWRRGGTPIIAAAWRICGHNGGDRRLNRKEAAISAAALNGAAAAYLGRACGLASENISTLANM